MRNFKVVGTKTKYVDVASLDIESTANKNWDAPDVLNMIKEWLSSLGMKQQDYLEIQKWKDCYHVKYIRDNYLITYNGNYVLILARETSVPIIKEILK